MVGGRFEIDIEAFEINVSCLFGSHFNFCNDFLFRCSVDEAAKLKPVLQRGLECIRGVGNHGLDTALLTKLAQYFASKVSASRDCKLEPS